jgi:hypothetical protein
MDRKYTVELSDAEREQLEKLVAAGRERARTLTRARILLKTDSSAAGA